MIWICLISIFQLPFMVQLLVWMAFIPQVYASQHDFLNISWPICDTHYAADHEHFLDPNENMAAKRLYTNNAQYLKVGQNLWVDRSFSKAILNGMFSFHVLRLQMIIVIVNSPSQEFTRFEFWGSSKSASTELVLS